MTEIKPGTELNRAVAEAVGDPFPRAHDWLWTGLPDVYRCGNCGDIDLADEAGGRQKSVQCLRLYSTDLNAAFVAAEKAGVFSKDRDSFLCRTAYGKEGSGEEWKVWCEQGRKLQFECSYHGSTPALAICAAILGLTEEK